ncbi:MAG: hypothetical protein KBT39_02830, partial [Bacteroidales bacterium]|nr:hypothetical protein [Bacteroidales bacterium]
FQGFSDGYSINGSKRHSINHKGWISVFVVQLKGGKLQYIISKVFFAKKVQGFHFTKASITISTCYTNGTLGGTLLKGSTGFHQRMYLHSIFRMNREKRWNPVEPLDGVPPRVPPL